MRRVQEERLLLHGEGINARARVAAIPEEAPDLGCRVHGDRAILDQLVERLPDGSNDVAHETLAPALTEQMDDEATDIVTRHRRHRLTTKAGERVMLQCAQVERLSADAELPELRVRRDPAPRSLLERRRRSLVEEQVLTGGACWSRP